MYLANSSCHIAYISTSALTAYNNKYIYIYMYLYRTIVWGSAMARYQNKAQPVMITQTSTGANNRNVHHQLLPCTKNSITNVNHHNTHMIP